MSYSHSQLERRVDVCRNRLDRLEADRRDAANRARYRLANLEKESNTKRLRELRDQGYEFDLSQAIGDCEGRSPAECDRLIDIIKKYGKRKSGAITPRPEDVAQGEVIRFQMIERAARYRAEGRKVTAAEVLAEIKAEARG